MPRTERPPRLPAVLLEALFPSPQLLTGRLAASTVAMYTRDCAAYVAFCGYDGVLAGQAHEAFVINLLLRQLGYAGSPEHQNVTPARCSG